MRAGGGGGCGDDVAPGAVWAQAFVRDLDPESECFPTSLGKLVERLKGWKATLQTAVEDYMPPILKLEDESRSLQVGARGQGGSRGGL